MSTKDSKLDPPLGILPVGKVINNNQPGWKNIVETEPGVTLSLGTRLYKQSDVFKVFEALCTAWDRVEELEGGKLSTKPEVPFTSPHLQQYQAKSELPKGVMAALLAGWTGHKPYIHREEFKGVDARPWVALYGPHEGPNADWFGYACNFKLEPAFIQWLDWAKEERQTEIRDVISKALGVI